MFQELVAVVGQHDNHRVVVEPVGLQTVHEHAELGIVERNLGVVEVLHIPTHDVSVERWIRVQRATGSRPLDDLGVDHNWRETIAERLPWCVGFVGVGCVEPGKDRPISRTGL